MRLAHAALLSRLVGGVRRSAAPGSRRVAARSAPTAALGYGMAQHRAPADVRDWARPEQAVSAYNRGVRSMRGRNCRSSTRTELGCAEYVRWRCSRQGRTQAYVEAYLAGREGVHLRVGTDEPSWSGAPPLPADLVLDWALFKELVRKAKRTCRRAYVADGIAFVRAEMERAHHDSQYATEVWRFYVAKYGSDLEGDAFVPGRRDMVPSARSACLAAYCAARAALATAVLRAWEDTDEGPPLAGPDDCEPKELVRKTYVDADGFFSEMLVWVPIGKPEEDRADRHSLGLFPLTLDAGVSTERRLRRRPRARTRRAPSAGVS